MEFVYIKTLGMKKENALMELGKERAAEQLESFRNLTRECNEFRCPLNDQFLLRFLRARKFNKESALNLLRQYYKMQRDNPTLFQNLNPKFMFEALSEKLQIVAKSRDQHGRNVFIFRAGAWDPEKVNLDEIFRCNYLYLEEITSTKETQINGISAIVDFNGFSLFQAKCFTPKHAIRMVKIIQGSFPCRFKEFHLVNQPYVFNLVLSIVKPFLKEKLIKRIHVHGQNLKSLHEFINPEILPDFLDGRSTNWETYCDEYIQGMLDKDKYYKKMSEYGYFPKEESDANKSSHD